MRVSALTLRNEQLSQEVEKMKERLLQGDGCADDREQLLAETNELLAETDRMERLQKESDKLLAESDRVALQSQEVAKQQEEMAQQRAKLQAEAREVEAEKAKVQAERDEVLKLQAELKEAQAKQARSQQASQQASAEGADFWDDRDVDSKLQQPTSAEVVVIDMQDDEPTRVPSNPNCNEGRLRGLLTSPATTSAQLRQAIGAVEALLEEAKRELGAKQLRERRAAFERLHSALDKGREADLEEAIAAARVAEVDLEDIEKAEAKLAQLQSLTEEERAAIASRELEQRRKKEAFLLVKKDNEAALIEFLDGLEEGVRWQDWHDYAGRTLRRCARELRSARAEKVLAERLAPQASEQDKFQPKFSIANAMRQAAAATSSRTAEAAPATVKSEARSLSPEPAAAAPDVGAVVEAPLAVAPTSEEPVEQASLTPQEEAELKAKALRAVVQDDCQSLSEVISRAPTDAWSRWENKAGKDLLTLSQERGSSSAYSLLAKALGLVQEMKREAFEERDTVWIFLPGEVQPVRATVLEDTPEEADAIYIEYWDGDAPPTHVDRCMVRRMWS